jgi:hypothetical protein
VLDQHWKGKAGMIDSEHPYFRQLLNWMQCAFGEASVRENSAELSHSKAIESFIESGNCILLEIYQDMNGKVIYLLILFFAN